jgi:hypothetical protein
VSTGQRYDPSWEAYARLNDRYEVRVLEPSPPAVGEGPWFADDPAARGDVPPGWQVVSPVSTGDLLWSDLASRDRSLAGWCAERWLGAYRRLGPAPAALVKTRNALHRLAEERISPARRAANGKIGLRYTCAGFGTPFFGEDQQLRVQAGEQVELIEVRGAVEVGREPLDVDSGAARFLGDWYGFAASVLGELRAGADPNDAVATRVQLWPEHFDMAVELGSEAGGARAAYGLSPGDEAHAEPYAYVGPWVAPPPGELWQATGFTGAELSYAELLAADDQRGAVLAFFRARLAALSER